MKQKSVQDVDMLGHFGKTGIGYWQRTMFRQTYTRMGSPGGKELGNGDCSWEAP